MLVRLSGCIIACAAGGTRTIDTAPWVKPIDDNTH
jgi:hypothetical protein